MLNVNRYGNGHAKMVLPDPPSITASDIKIFDCNGNLIETIKYSDWSKRHSPICKTHGYRGCTYCRIVGRGKGHRGRAMNTLDVNT